MNITLAMSNSAQSFQSIKMAPSQSATTLPLAKDSDGDTDGSTASVSSSRLLDISA